MPCPTAIHLITAMNALSILAMAMVIYLFGGYLDAAEVHPTTTVGGAAVKARIFNLVPQRGNV